MGNNISIDQYNQLMSRYGSAAVTVFFIGCAICALGCFLGYKITKVIVAICGFLLGITAGAAIGGALDISVLVIPLALILGVVFAIVAYKIYKVGIFLMTFFWAGLFAMGFAFGLSGQKLDEPVVLLIIGVIVGIIAGVIAVILTKPMLIITTSFNYGMLSGAFLAMAINHIGLALPLGLAFTVAGLVVQIKTNDGLLEHPERQPLSQNYAPPQYVNPYAVPGQQPPQQNGQYNDFLGNKRF